MTRLSNRWRQCRTVRAAAICALLTLPVVAHAQASGQPSGGPGIASGATANVRTAPPKSPVPSAIRTAFAPDGTLHAVINLGNPVLAGWDEASGQPVGVSVDLARALAQQLGVPLALVPVKSAGESVAKVAGQQGDIGFFAIDPKRGQDIAFTGPYVLIEGNYLVRKDSPITSNEQVDRDGNTVAVGKGSAYDLYLSRELHHATIVRIPTSPAVVQTFLDKHYTVAAGVRQQLEENARHLPGLRILNERFMEIDQAMGVPKSRGEAASAYLARFVEQQKASGFVARSLARHHINGAMVAPAS